MSYTNVYPTRINWENEPSINTPINETNLNKMDYALYEHDRTFATWDTTKANQSDLLLSVKTIDYDDETGVFIFTWQNGTTKTVDLNIEKIPVSFSMSPQGVITMTTDDGSTYTADVGALIKTYTFTDSSVIDFTVTTDLSGNKTITADIVDGSITGTKLQPNYLADCTAAKTAAETAEDNAEDSAEDAEAWAVGERGGVPVDPSDPTYHNNSKYWSQQAPANSLVGLTDTDINNPQDGEVLAYDSIGEKWINATPSAGGGSTLEVTTTELTLFGTTATLTDGVTTLTASFDGSGKATFTGITMTGNLTLTATDGLHTATRTVNLPYFGNYTEAIGFFNATITVTYPASLGATCSITDGVTTLNATGSPMSFSIPNTGTWKATAILDGVSKDGSNISITTDGQTASDAIEYGTINLTYANEFRSLTLTCTDGVTTISKVAPSSGNTMAFYPPNTGTWTISGVYSGVTYSSGSITVSSLSTPVSATIQTLATITVTIYGAKQDVITFTDAAGVSHTVTFASGATSKSESLKVNPTGTTSITFTSSVSKKPSNLSQNYSKNVSLTTSTTAVYVMPDHTLYWYGYLNSNICEEISTANGWSGNGMSGTPPTYNLRSLSLPQTSGGTVVSGIGTKQTISGTLKAIMRQTNGYGGQMGGLAAKTALAAPDPVVSPSSTSDQVISVVLSSKVAIIWSFATNSGIVSAFWYE